MAADRPGSLEQRVLRTAEAVLAERKFVSPIELLVGLGWLLPARVEEWRQGRVDYLERVLTVNLTKLSTAMAVFRRWARQGGLVPSETAYVARMRYRGSLRFSKSGDPGDRARVSDPLGLAGAVGQQAGALGGTTGSPA